MSASVSSVTARAAAVWPVATPNKMIFNWYKVKVEMNRCVCERERERERGGGGKFSFLIDEVETTERSVKLYIVE